MKTIQLTLLFSLLPILAYSQDKIAGIFTSTQVIQHIGQQQIAQQGDWGRTITVERSYLNVNGKIYDLYRLSKGKIHSSNNQSVRQGQQQQTQKSYVEDFYLVGHQSENGKHCVIQGVIDENKRIIYEATLVKVFDKNDITKIINECGIE